MGDIQVMQAMGSFDGGSFHAAMANKMTGHSHVHRAVSSYHWQAAWLTAIALPQARAPTHAVACAIVRGAG
jgi:hypothetical protein